MINKPRGCEDILPDNIGIWQYIEKTVHKICSVYNFREIRVPVFEHTELFLRGVGDTTDIVQKEMYTFLDKGERSITLRPEGTASVVRSYLENSMYNNPQPTKLFYNMTCYRYEKPQAGRLREFHQFGLECFGARSPETDAEIISLAVTLLDTLEIKNLNLYINSIGCPVCRKDYSRKLIEYFSAHEDELCGTCNERLHKNPMRILDCKSPVCSKLSTSAPKMLDCLCQDCSSHFEALKNILNNLEIKYEINPNIVRGLDYYTKTVFEITSDNLGAQSTLCGGGRYDSLVEELGGKPTPGIGFAMGIERLIMIMKNQNIEIPNQENLDIYIVALGEDADIYSQKLVYKLRKNGKSAEKDLCGRSLKAQMKYADKINAKYTMVLGDEEIKSETVELKNMTTGEKTQINISELENYL